MTLSINFSRTDEQLEDQEIASIVTAFYRLENAARLRRQLAEAMPRVKAAVDAARALDQKPDIPAIARQVLVDQKMLELD